MSALLLVPALAASAAEPPREFAHPTEVSTEIPSPVSVDDWPEDCHVDVEIRGGEVARIEAPACGADADALIQAVRAGTLRWPDAPPVGWVRLHGPHAGDGQAGLHAMSALSIRPPMQGVRWKSGDYAGRSVRCVLPLRPLRPAAGGGPSSRLVARSAAGCPEELDAALAELVAGATVKLDDLHDPSVVQRLVVWAMPGLEVGGRRRNVLALEGQPVPFSTVWPKYPGAMLLEDRGPVSCAMELDLDVTGRPTRVRSSDENSDLECGPLFQRASARALRRWVFVPAIEDGAPVAAQYRMVVQFRQDLRR